MKKAILGKTGIEVSGLCFGALPMGPLQKNIPIEAGANLIKSGLDGGINFLDTAQVYQTYSYIREALKGFEGEVFLASKSMAVTYEDMEKAVLEALEALDRGYVDIFHLHAARVKASVFEERKGALQCLKDFKKKGIIRAVGIATHAVEVVERAAEVEDIDVVFPLINQTGLGIVGGTRDDMIKAIYKAHQSGKGLYAMKALAGGHLIGQLKEAFVFVRNIPGISSVAVGMVDGQELEINLKIFNDEEVPWEPVLKAKANKRLLVSDFCKGCGACVDACPNGALTMKEGKAEVDHQICLLCGYCNPVCPQFALRLI